MGIGRWIGKALTGGNLIDQAASVAREYIEDPDVRNQVIQQIVKSHTDLQIARTNAKTIPWVDALHKMGRLILGVTVLTCYTVLRLNDVEVDLAQLGLAAGPAGLYTLMKGRGR